jgi:hypothetical protein
MTFEEAVEQMKTTHPAQFEFLDRVLNARPRERLFPEMPPFTRKRESLMQLRPRHLVWVEELGHRREDFDRSYWHDYMLTNYNRLFGRIRSKHKEVPSDAFRKSMMISNLLDLVEARRAEYAAERASIR